MYNTHSSRRFIYKLLMFVQNGFTLGVQMFIISYFFLYVFEFFKFLLEFVTTNIIYSKSL